MEERVLRAAQRLAKFHFEVEPEIRHIFLLGPWDNNRADAIRLLEVVDGAIERGIEPISFPADAAHGIDLPSVIVEVSPREFQQLDQNNIPIRGSQFKVERELTRHA